MSDAPTVDTTSEIITVADLQNLWGELRLMARKILASESHAQSVTPTALAAAALVRSKPQDLDWDDIQWENRAHFLAALTSTMRHVLVDRARRRKANGRNKIEYRPWDEKVLIDLPGEVDSAPDMIIALYEALAVLKETHPDYATALEHYYFLGYSVKEIATLAGKEERTIKRRLHFGRIHLKETLTKQLAMA